MGSSWSSPSWLHSSVDSVLKVTPMKPPRAFDTIIYGGLTAGTLDILDAFIVSGLRGVSPERVLRYIASGVLGPNASQGGLEVAALGLGLHFVIALGAATTFWAASQKLSILVRRPVICGLAFGLGVWAFMQYVVVPLSLVRGAAGAPPLLLLLNQFGIHALGVGLPIALFANWSARRSQDQPRSLRGSEQTMSV
jgi:hypothetical protein